jgi:S-DNA-T family DNA segregation ATPase FtsK/SpoIIIE
VLWSIIAGLAPGVRVGWVRLLVIDPKGGMEFGRGQNLFTGFAYDNGENTLGLLRAVTTVMQQRAQRLRGHTRFPLVFLSAKSPADGIVGDVLVYKSSSG